MKEQTKRMAKKKAPKKGIDVAIVIAKPSKGKNPFAKAKGKAAGGKCPECGGAMKDGKCTKCGYTE